MSCKSPTTAHRFPQMTSSRHILPFLAIHHGRSNRACWEPLSSSVFPWGILTCVRICRRSGLSDDIRNGLDTPEYETGAVSCTTPTSFDLLSTQSLGQRNVGTPVRRRALPGLHNQSMIHPSQLDHTPPSGFGRQPGFRRRAEG